VQSDLEWGRLLVALALLAIMFVVPVLVIWRDQRADRRRYGPAGARQPIRYAPDGRAYREGVPIAGAPSGLGQNRRSDAPVGEHASRGRDRGGATAVPSGVTGGATGRPGP
jgi:hypothetical protein